MGSCVPRRGRALRVLAGVAGVGLAQQLMQLVLTAEVMVDAVDCHRGLQQQIVALIPPPEHERGSVAAPPFYRTMLAVGELNAGPAPRRHIELIPYLESVDLGHLFVGSRGTGRRGRRRHQRSQRLRPHHHPHQGSIRGLGIEVAGPGQGARLVAVQELAS